MAERKSPQLVIPLDNCTESEARALVAELSGAGVVWFKVGLELFTSCGPRFVQDLKAKGLNVFLDLKLHDIPNTVAKATKSAVAIGADLLTVHCSGGPDMLAAARDAASGSRLSLLGVTVLTSMDGESLDSVRQAFGAGHESRGSRETVVLNLASLAAKAGLPGFVCSAPDLESGELLRLSWPGKAPLVVTPGIRSAGESRDDQKSIATVEEAVKRGSTHLVIGRPITAPRTGTRVEAAARVLREIEVAHGVTAHS